MTDVAAATVAVMRRTEEKKRIPYRHACVCDVFCNTHSGIRDGPIRSLAACGAGRSTPYPSPTEPLPEACCTGKRHVSQIASSPSLYRVIGWHLRSPKQVAGLDKHILAVRGHRRDLWVSTSVRGCRFGLKSYKLRLQCVFISGWFMRLIWLLPVAAARPQRDRERGGGGGGEKKVCVCVRERDREREYKTTTTKHVYKTFTYKCVWETERVKRKRCVRSLYSLCVYVIFVCVCVCEREYKKYTIYIYVCVREKGGGGRDYYTSHITVTRRAFTRGRDWGICSWWCDSCPGEL